MQDSQIWGCYRDNQIDVEGQFAQILEVLKGGEDGRNCLVLLARPLEDFKVWNVALECLDQTWHVPLSMVCIFVGFAICDTQLLEVAEPRIGDDVLDGLRSDGDFRENQLLYSLVLSGRHGGRVNKGMPIVVVKIWVSEVAV